MKTVAYPLSPPLSFHMLSPWRGYIAMKAGWLSPTNSAYNQVCVSLDTSIPSRLTLEMTAAPADTLMVVALGPPEPDHQPNNMASDPHKRCHPNFTVLHVSMLQETVLYTSGYLRQSHCATPTATSTPRPCCDDPESRGEEDPHARMTVRSRVSHRVSRMNKIQTSVCWGYYHSMCPNTAQM